jgi:TfoX/Sxy family transcriptional regulator of competence genes
LLGSTEAVYFVDEAMTEPYLERLSQIVDRLMLDSAERVTLEIKHFFSGAALYANGKICGSLSPAGFALKLPARVGQTLIDEGKGREFRYFAKGPIKREYVALSESIIQDEGKLAKLIEMSVSYAIGALDASAAVNN